MTGQRTRGTVLFGLALVALFLASPTRAADVDPKVWDEWNRATKDHCPSHHLELLGDVYDELIGGFSKTLPRSVDRSATRIADYSKRCAAATMGFYCEMDVYLDAYKKLGLLEKFAAFSCQQYKCLEAAYCVSPQTGKFR